jgi:peptidoglycan L-alanyl-D-glutamate endopeptidase CwlK
MVVSELKQQVRKIQALVGAKVDGDYGINTAKAIAIKFNLTDTGNLYNITKKIQYYIGAKVDGDFGVLSAALTLHWLNDNAVKEEEEKTIPPPPTGIFDDRTEKVLKSLDPKASVIFRKFLTEAIPLAKSKYGVEYKLISGNRTYAEQNALYAKGRTAPGNRVTNARGGQSNHNFGIAVDAGVFKDSKYLDDTSPGTAEKVHREVSKLITKYNLEWGGDWKSIVDIPHFEVDTGYTMARKRELMASKGSVL